MPATGKARQGVGEVGRWRNWTGEGRGGAGLTWGGTGVGFHHQILSLMSGGEGANVSLLVSAPAQKRVQSQEDPLALQWCYSGEGGLRGSFGGLRVQRLPFCYQMGAIELRIRL